MNILLVMTARQVGGAESCAEGLVSALTAQGRAPADSCRFTVALSDCPELDALAAGLSRCAHVMRFPFDQPSRLPGVTRSLRHLAAQQDVIHINSNHPASRLGILMSFVLPASGRPVITVEQRATPLSDIRVPRSLAWALPTLFRWSRRRVARVIAVSEENRRTLTEFYRLPSEKITLVHNGIDLSPFAGPVAAPSLRRELGLAPDQPVILVLGRLAPNKGQQHLVEAAPAILAHFPTAHFVFAGDPDGRALLDERIRITGLQDHFSLIGFRTDVANLLRSSDLFVLPSLAEGFSLAIIEALAAGLPVIATRVGGAAEIIEEGRNGYLVPPADAGALAGAVNRALSLDAVAIARMRQYAAESAQLFSLDATASRMLEIYRQVTGKGA
jgi:glycosyltransferase involved in cell wall biosynthesis